MQSNPWPKSPNAPVSVDLRKHVHNLAYDPVVLSPAVEKDLHLLSAREFGLDGQVVLALTVYEFPKSREGYGIRHYIYASSRARIASPSFSAAPRRVCSMPLADSNKAVVREFLEEFSTGYVVEILAHMHDAGSWWVSGSIAGISGTYDKRKFGKLLEEVTGVYKTGALRITPTSMIAEGDKVAAEAECYAELKNGRVYNSRYHLLFETIDGRVEHVWEYMDTHHPL